jgi:cob(I)alamin adenosyltransferase
VGAGRQPLNPSAAACVDRAERLVVELAAQPAEQVNEAVIKYLNRLSDFLFVAARAANAEGAGDVLWVPGGNR